MRPPPLPPAAVALVLVSTWVASVRPDTLGHGEELLLEPANPVAAGERGGRRAPSERSHVELDAAGGATRKVKRHGDSQVRFSSPQFIN